MSDTPESSPAPTANVALRREAERIARQRAADSAELVDHQSSDSLRELLHNLGVHQIELELQNDELRKAQEEIEASRARLFDLYDAAPVGYCTLDESGLILRANLMAATMLGTTRSALQGQPFSRFVAEENQDSYYLLRRRMAGDSQPHTCELRLKHSVGPAFWALLTFTSGREPDGSPHFKLVLSDITPRKLLEIQEQHERCLLELLATGQPLEEMLRTLVLTYETILPGMRGSVLLLDETGQHLRHGAAPNLPLAYCQAIDGIAIGPQVGSCGTAAYRGQTVIVSDIVSDPLWHDFKSLALAHGLRACWSVPILGASSRVLGTLAFYFDTPRSSRPEELEVIGRGAYLASLAVQGHRATADLQHAHDALEQRVGQRTAELNDANERLQQEHQRLERLLRASDHERQLIAYDIHDGLAQELAGAIMQFETYREGRETQRESAATAFQSGMTLLRQCFAEARRIISHVRPPVLDESGIRTALIHLIRDPALSAGPHIRFRSRGMSLRMEPVLEDVVYRIVQEGLSNARHHSQSSEVHITCVQHRGRLRIRIRDWGVGFDLDQVDKNCFGLEGIRARARLLQGTCRIRSELGRGTTLIVDLPVR